jgi:tetratricopeptide (TPR) repeat protein
MFETLIVVLLGATRGRGVVWCLERHCLFLALIIASSVTAAAKEASLTAVVLFDSPQGAAYVQIAGATLNGKTEVRLCEDLPRLDKNTYNGLLRASLVGAKRLERGLDGVLTLTTNDKPVCIVPSNLKFERNMELTPTEAAEQAVIQGTPIPSSAGSSSIPAFKPGVQLVFIPAPDVEFAEFLRAQRANTLKDWQDFLFHYPSTARRAAALTAIAELHQKAAEAAFAQFTKSGKQDLAMLRQATTEAQAASQAFPSYQAALKLIDSISRELDGLLEQDRQRLEAYRKILQGQTAGGAQFGAAIVHVKQLSEVWTDYPPLETLRREIAIEERKLQTAVGHAESLVLAARYDEALTFLGPYSALAAEMPRIDAILNSAYKYHMNNGQRLGGLEDWDQAVGEFRKAAAIRPDSKEAQAALNNASTQLQTQRDQKAAHVALLASKDYASKNQLVEAYNVLADLPDQQRALVTAQLSALGRSYVSAAKIRAQNLQEAHLPIKGRSDEDAVLEAFRLLDRACSLSGDPAITVKRDFLSSKISAYYLDLATRYLQRPSGSGAGMGWLYLKQAQHYGVINQDSIKDVMARYQPVYQRRSRISVGIVLRDQTSRRDSPGFADQLADAIANGLDSSAVSVDVIRKPAEASDALQPNFLLVGEVLEHRVVKNVNLEAPESKYRAGTHETVNPAWLQAKRDYEAAQQQLALAQHTLADAQSLHKKKDVLAAANAAAQEAQKHADELQHKLETTDPKQVERVFESYHYTKKTIDLNASIDLAFRWEDRVGKIIGQPGDVRKDNRKSTVVLRDVKPEDSEGITNQGVEPEEGQFLTDLEIEARNAMVKALREQAAELPAMVLQLARTDAQHGDLDGAAEEYVIYLNSTPENGGSEREEAANFLREKFNVAVPLTPKGAPKGETLAAR